MKLQNVKSDLPASTLSIDDLRKMYPDFSEDNINFYINVACDGYNRSNGTFERTEQAQNKLNRELEKTKELLDKIRKRKVLPAKLK